MSGIVSVCLSVDRHDKKLEASLDSIQRATCEASVLVCDHSRNEVATEKFQWSNPDITVLYSSKKIRYTEAINSVTANRLGRYLIVMDPGIRFDRDVLSRMITYMETHPAIAVLSPLTVDRKGMEIPVPRKRLSVRYLLSILFRFSPDLFKTWYRSLTMTDRTVTAPVSVQNASSLFMLIRSEAFIRLGGFNTGYNRFLADSDFCSRVLESHAGSIVWHPEMTVIADQPVEDHRECPLRRLLSALRYSVRWRVGL